MADRGNVWPLMGGSGLESDIMSVPKIQDTQVVELIGRNSARLGDIERRARFSRTRAAVTSRQRGVTLQRIALDYIVPLCPMNPRAAHEHLTEGKAFSFRTDRLKTEEGSRLLRLLSWEIRNETSEIPAGTRVDSWPTVPT